MLRLGLGQGVRVAVELVRRLAQGASDQPGLAVEVVERVTARARELPVHCRCVSSSTAWPSRCAVSTSSAACRSASATWRAAAQLSRGTTGTANVRAGASSGPGGANTARSSKQRPVKLQVARGDRRESGLDLLVVRGQCPQGLLGRAPQSSNFGIERALAVRHLPGQLLRREGDAAYDRAVRLGTEGQDVGLHTDVGHRARMARIGWACRRLSTGRPRQGRLCTSRAVHRPRRIAS